MKLVILGATGPSGQCLVTQALNAGHEVTAVVRNPAKMTATHNNLKVAEADIFSESSLQPHLEGQDVVLSCLGVYVGWLQPITFYSKSIKSIIAAMRGAKVNRLLVVTSWSTNSEGPFFLRRVIKPLFLKEYCADMGRMEDYLLQECQDINITVIKPPGLGKEDTVSAKEIQAVEGQWVPGGSYIFQRADLARFMLSCLHTDKWNRKLVSVSY